MSSFYDHCYCNAEALRHIFVGGDVLDAPRKNDVTSFFDTSSTTGAAPAVPLSRCGSVTLGV